MLSPAIALLLTGTPPLATPTTTTTTTIDVASPPVVQASDGDSAAQDPAARFTGKYQFIGGERQRGALRDAIDKAVESLNFLIRGIGRKRLTAVTKIPESVVYMVQPHQITMVYQGRPAVRAPADGTPKSGTDPQGKSMTMSFRVDEKGRLIQRFDGENGSRTNVVTLNEDGTRMTIRVTLRSKRLDDPLRYTLTYKRIPFGS